MPKALTPSALALTLEKAGRQEIRRHHLSGTVNVVKIKQQGGAEHYRVVSPTPVAVPDGRMGSLPGRWTVKMAWEIFSDPSGGDARVMMSSVSLNVEEVTLTEAGDHCLVRYDTNHFEDAPAWSHSAVHLNVLQPPSLNSSVHYPIFGLDHDHWPLDLVLDFFLSEDLQQDLAPHI